MRTGCLSMTIFLACVQGLLFGEETRNTFPLGFTVAEIPEETIFAGAKGTILEITRVKAGSPASLAGLRGKDILLEVDGQQIRTADHLDIFLKNAGPESELLFSVFREGMRLEIKMVPGLKLGRVFDAPPEKLPGPAPKSETRISILFPVVSQVSRENDENLQIGAGLEIDYRIHSRFCVNAALFVCRDRTRAPNFWASLNGGVDFEFIKTSVFYCFLRPSVSLMYIRERGDRFHYNTLGFGLSILGGFQIKLTEEADLGFFAGTGYVVLRDEGTGAGGFGQDDGINPVYGGMYLRIDL